MDDQLALAVRPWFQRFADALADEIARIDEQLAKLVLIRETPEIRQ